MFFQEGEPFCSEEVTDGQLWPKTPSGDTVINRTCEEGRVGYKSRTCEGTTWELVFSHCVNDELNSVVNAADVSVASSCDLAIKGSICIFFHFYCQKDKAK